jgi:N-acetylmuramoyl-L-alanine amidase
MADRSKRETKRERELRERRAYYAQLPPEEKRAYRERRIREKKLRKLKHMAVSSGVMLALIVISVIGVLLQRGGRKTPGTQQNSADPAQSSVRLPDYVVENLIRKNPYSRPGDPLEQVNGIVVHYIGNAGTTAENNRNYFDSLADQKEGEDARSASSHFIIDLDGTVILCVPLNEIAYASNSRNADTISIECCHEDETGKFNDATYMSLVKLVKWLEEEYDLKPENVIRHYDVTGKECPRYFVQNEEAWNQFLKDIER